MLFCLTTTASFFRSQGRREQGSCKLECFNAYYTKDSQMKTCNISKLIEFKTSTTFASFFTQSPWRTIQMFQRFGITRIPLGKKKSFGCDWTTHALPFHLFIRLEMPDSNCLFGTSFKFRTWWDNMECWCMVDTSMGRYFVHFCTTVSFNEGFYCCNGIRCHCQMGLSRSSRVYRQTSAALKLPCPFIDLLQGLINIVMLSFHPVRNFDGFHHLTTRKPRHRALLFRGTGRRWSRLSTAEPSCNIQASCWHLSFAAQTTKCTAASLQDNRAVFEVF